MSITDELRGFAPHLDLGKVALAGWKESLLAIADRIDAEHERQLEVLYRDMSDAEYVKLPKDADGEYIHVGERVQLIGNDPGTVSHMSLADDGWRVYVKYDGGIGTGSGEPKHIRHHHAPTVEDVLREFAFQIGQSTTDDDIVAEYAAKLRLKEDE